ncbi:hypothetical protein CAPTEDRAFT_104963, partial [Capitella teleta]
CIPCAIGNYQNESAQTECIPCDDMHSTATTGSVNESQCILACLPGFFFNSTSESCQPCSLGYYQPENGTTVCLGCPTGKTTLLLNSTAESDCVGRFPVLVYHLQKAKE